MGRRIVSSNRLVCIVAVVFGVFALLMVFSPLILPAGSVSDLSGSVGVIDNAWVWEQMPFPVSAVYAFGDVLCHQELERSFVLNENQLPFCARCMGIWLGLAVGLTALCFVNFPVDIRLVLVLFLCCVPLGIDGFGQLFGWWSSSQVSRLLTGLFCGGGLGAVFGAVLSMGQVKSK